MRCSHDPLAGGGAAADGLTAPFDVVWEGDRTYGIYDRAANTFAPDDGIEELTVVSTAGSSATSTILLVAPQLSTGNHYARLLRQSPPDRTSQAGLCFPLALQ